METIVGFVVGTVIGILLAIALAVGIPRPGAGALPGGTKQPSQNSLRTHYPRMDRGRTSGVIAMALINSLVVTTIGVYNGFRR